MVSTLLVTTVLNLGTFLAVVIFFVIIILQEIQEFKDKPLPVSILRKGAPPPPSAANRKDSLERRITTLEMTSAGGEDFGSREHIIAEGLGGACQKRKDLIGYDNPCMDPFPSANVCEV